MIASLQLVLSKLIDQIKSKLVNPAYLTVELLVIDYEHHFANLEVRTLFKRNQCLLVSLCQLISFIAPLSTGLPSPGTW